LPELRKDYILDRWVVIATERAKRPHDFKREERVVESKTCPFCPGNEHMTPPATLLLKRDEEGNLVFDCDKGDERVKGWITRCFPNLYPAFVPPKGEYLEKRVPKIAHGHHEVLVETPNHDEHPPRASVEQLYYALLTLQKRAMLLAEKQYVEYISMFRNYGPRGGASLYHPHMQIIASPLVPKLVMEELTASDEYYQEHGECLYCRVVKQERKTERFIYENQHFLAIAPWASRFPFEFWILPKEHSLTFLDEGEEKLRALAEILRKTLGALSEALHDPSYNLAFHVHPLIYGFEGFHWHIEVYPRLTTLAGFELGGDIYINVTPPEVAAEELKKRVEG